MSAQDRWDEEDWEPDDDEAYEVYGEEPSETEPCPQCGSDVYEDAEQCPHCGHYLIHSSSGTLWRDRPMWWIALGALGILAVIVSLILF